MNNCTRFFLVILRLAIGWLILVEGLDKIRSDNWSSEGYLREATGPLAARFRNIAGDPVEQRLIPGDLPAGQDASKTQPYRRMPPALAHDWDHYYERFVAYYQLDEKQRSDAEAKFRQREAQVVNWLTLGQRKVKKTSPWGPPVEVDETTTERVHDYLALRDRAWQIETKEMPIFGSDVNTRLKSAKADAAKVRSELVGSPAKAAEWVKQLDQLEKPIADKKKQADDLAIKLRDAEEQLLKLEKQGAQDGGQPAAPEETAKLKKNLDQLKARQQDTAKELATLQDRYASLMNDLDISKHTALMRRSLQSVLTPEQKQLPPLPDRVKPGWDVREWTLLDWSDNLVKYGLTAVGFCLLAGLFTRTACVAGAFFLLMFVLAMPPLPGLPDNPKVEGHYLFINKNLIMVAALLTLATTRSGRWLGIDGLLQFLCPCGRSKAAAKDAVPPEPAPPESPARDLTPGATSPDNGVESSAESAPIQKGPSDGH